MTNARRVFNLFEFKFLRRADYFGQINEINDKLKDKNVFNCIAYCKGSMAFAFLINCTDVNLQKIYAFTSCTQFTKTCARRASGPAPGAIRAI